MKSLCVVLLFAAVGYSQTIPAISSQTTTVVWDRAPVFASHVQRVEPLTGEEKHRLQAARQRAAEAQKELDHVEADVRHAHGDSPARKGWCDSQETIVTFWGDYALIEVNPLSGCAVTW